MALLFAALEDADPRTRRTAASALGRMRAAGGEARLLEVLATERDVSTLRAVVQSLGKLGGADSLRELDRLRAGDPETARVLAEARMKLSRDHARGQPSEIDSAFTPAEPLEIFFHCRAGLESLVQAELPAHFHASVRGPALVSARLEHALAQVFQSRVMTHVGFPLPEVPLADPAALEAAVVSVLTSEYALSVLRAFTRGQLRYRLHWEGAGHRRGLTYRVASAVSAACPELVNDPQQSPWEARVSITHEKLRIELCPRRLDDPRFAYRVSDVPAASHPTIAAALARIGGVRAGDRVWDPCVGSGLELVERGLLGPYAELWGTDLAESALAAARKNLAAAGLARVQLVRADARSFTPPRPVDLIITNPPYGRRAQTGAELEQFYAALLDRARQALAPAGRLVWISPLFETSVRIAEGLGLHGATRRRVDMGGFKAELQMFHRERR
ncbi:MAG TPA: methyltransferase [Polyangiales bacterium]|nr:methyltransferase [Polyangiales bacterium]